MYGTKIENINYMLQLYPVQTGVNNPILRTISKEITEIDHDIKDFADTLRKLMYQYDGVGLAAPQLGKNIRMLATTIRKGKNKSLVGDEIIINPEIIEKSDEMVVSEEACLSIPDEEGSVKRHKKITVKYLDLDGKEKIKKLKDFNSFIMQHEIDHLDGILFVDKVIGRK